MKRQLKFLKRSAVSAGKTTYKTTKEDDWIECVSCRNWLHEFWSPHEDQYVDYGRKLLLQKKQQNAEDDLENLFLSDLNH
jgi:hypothetical protein